MLSAAAITTTSLFEYDAKLLANFLFRFPPFFLNIIRLEGGCRCTAIFRTPQRCSIRFKPRYWQRHSRTFKEWSQSHSFLILADCLGSFSCWKINLQPSSESSALWGRSVLHYRDDIGQVMSMTLFSFAFRPKSFIFVLDRPEIFLFFMVSESCRCLWQTLCGLSCAFY